MNITDLRINPHILRISKLTIFGRYGKKITTITQYKTKLIHI